MKEYLKDGYTVDMNAYFHNPLIKFNQNKCPVYNYTAELLDKFFCHTNFP